MDSTAYSIAASIFRYVFILLMAFVIVSVLTRSITSYHKLIKKKRRLIQIQNSNRCIEILEPEEYGGKFFYIEGAILIGSAEDDDIRFLDAGLKKHHALIYIKNSSVYIDSKQRKNVYINGERNVPKNTEMNDGDEIVIEQLCFVYRKEGEHSEKK